MPLSDTFCHCALKWDMIHSDVIRVHGSAGLVGAREHRRWVNGLLNKKCSLEERRFRTRYGFPAKGLQRHSRPLIFECIVERNRVPTYILTSGNRESSWIAKFFSPRAAPPACLCLFHLRSGLLSKHDSRKFAEAGGAVRLQAIAEHFIGEKVEMFFRGMLLGIGVLACCIR